MEKALVKGPGTNLIKSLCENKLSKQLNSLHQESSNLQQTKGDKVGIDRKDLNLLKASYERKSMSDVW